MAITYTDLTALTKQSARVAQFFVKVDEPEVIKYSFKGKRDQKEHTAKRFQCFLVGQNPEGYCIAFAKDEHGQLENALQTFTQNSVWVLSKPAFDSAADAAYISTPLKFKVDVCKSTLAQVEDAALLSLLPATAVPPRTVADTAAISSTRSTDIIAVVKNISDTRLTKTKKSVATVELIDGSKSKQGKVATVSIGLFGLEKIAFVKENRAQPLVFFNLQIKCERKATEINHWEDAKVKVAPDSERTRNLQTTYQELQDKTDTQTLTTATHTHVPKDVSGPQPLSVCAFLDFTSESPQANMPPIVDVAWARLQEPQPSDEVLDRSGSRIWFVTQLADTSGGTLVGVPERAALKLTGCQTKEEFETKHASQEVLFPLFAHYRISRTVRAPAAGASQPAAASGDSGAGASQSTDPSHAFVSHVVEDVEVVTWDPASAPNASYTKILEVLNGCPPHDGAIVFAHLSDIVYDPHYGFEVRFGGTVPQVITKGKAVAALIQSERKSNKPLPAGEGFKVVTENVIDAGHEGKPAGFTLAAYCTMDDMMEYKLDPPRGQTARFAVVLINSVETNTKTTLMLDKVQLIEPADVPNVMKSFKKLRRLAMRLQPKSEEKKSHSLDNLLPHPPTEMPKCRKLGAVPTDASLPSPVKTRAETTED